MIYMRVLIAIIVVGSLVQSITCDGDGGSASPKGKSSVRPTRAATNPRAPSQPASAPAEPKAPTRDRGSAQPVKAPTRPRTPAQLTNAPTKPRAPTRSRSLNKDGTSPETNPPTRNRIPAIRPTFSSARSLSNDKINTTKPPQVNGKSQNIRSQEGTPDSNAFNDDEAKETGKQSKMLMPVRAIKRTGGFLFKSAVNTLTAPLNYVGKNII